MSTEVCAQRLLHIYKKTKKHKFIFISSVSVSYGNQMNIFFPLLLLLSPVDIVNIYVCSAMSSSCFLCLACFLRWCSTATYCIVMVRFVCVAQNYLWCFLGSCVVKHSGDRAQAYRLLSICFAWRVSAMFVCCNACVDITPPQRCVPFHWHFTAYWRAYRNDQCAFTIERILVIFNFDCYRLLCALELTLVGRCPPKRLYSQ